MSETLEAQIERILAPTAPEVREIALAVRDLVRELMPGAVEQVDVGDGLIAVGTGLGMRELVFAIIPHRAHVNLQLADGTELPDPSGIVDGTGKRIRHVTCRSLADVARPALRAIVAAQVALRGG